jgi:uracil-DNA glycosylase family 4
MPTAFDQLNQRIVACDQCPRLRAWCTQVAADKRAAYRDQTYHGRPVPNFGDPAARLLILGLAPGAHGANRTGRMFTGDRSGDFLFPAMHATGFASQPTSTHAGDGLTLIGAAITAAAHCAPPANKPTPDELRHCTPFLDATLAALPAFRLELERCALLVLGKIAFDQAAALYRRRRWWPGAPVPRFAHGAVRHVPGAPTLLCSYHPSQQNTFTGRLTAPMLQAVFEQARALLDAP